MALSKPSTLHSPKIIACVWDFDQTLIPGYMQAPLFAEYNIHPKTFWDEVNRLPSIYHKQGIRVSQDTIYLNHLLSYIKNGPLKGLNNRKLRELGKQIRFYPGIPNLFSDLKDFVKNKPEYNTHNIQLEHYIISTGITEMIRGSAIAPCVDGIFACEFIEEPLPPGYTTQPEFELPGDSEISQIGFMVDNTIKTRFIFEINKGSNKNPEINVNATIASEDRRVPISHMVYIADGPSDIPVFSVIKTNGGKTLAVYDPDNQEEFKQNDALRESGRIHHFSPADYTPSSPTTRWLKLQIEKIAAQIIKHQNQTLEARISQTPRHLHKNTPAPLQTAPPSQQNLWSE